MSLWSPVDLVSGGTGITNTNFNNNCLIAPQIRCAKRDEKCSQNYTSSLLYDHLLRRSSSKLIDHNVSKAIDSTVNRFVTKHDLSAANHSLKKADKRQTSKKSIDLRIGYPSLDSVLEKAIPLLKRRTSDEVNENCDKKYKNSKNLSTIMNSNEEEDCAPLDLCVKKVKPESNESGAHSATNDRLGGGLVHNNVSAAINTPQYNPSSYSSRRRGRKPKSLLATSNDSVATNLATPANLDTKPRKRGRPPTLSPPLSSIGGQQPLAAHSSNLKALSSSGAFQPQFPYAVLNTPLQPGWPSLSSTGQLVFPDKLNGNDINNIKFNKTSANVSESSDNIDSMASDSDSIENVSDTASQTSANKTCDLRQRLPDLSLSHTNDNHLRIPLHFGWRRVTKVTRIGRSGLEGEVFYYSPCARKLKNHSDIVKYLTKNGISNVSKDYFSFDPKAIVGDFLQTLPNTSTDVLLNEKEFRKHIEDLRRSANIRSERKRKSFTNSDGKGIPNKDMYRKFETEDLRHTREKRIRMGETKNKESDNIKDIHKFGMHSQRMSKTSVIEETKRKRQEELEKQEDLVRKAQERELKRQQMEVMREQEMQRRRELLIMADLERERRRQHMMLVRALEAHKRQEERERKKEELIAEKIRIQEKKVQKKRIEMELLRELKKPVDDMQLKVLKPLPTLNRIPGQKLPGKAFADTLMVFEFLHNFGETLGFDMESLPSLNTLSMALLNMDESAEEELLSVIHHLLICAIEDPGLPVNVTTIMGQKLKDAAITNYNITEILRLYFSSFDGNIREEDKDNRIESRMVGLLGKACPFLSLDATQKAEILAFLCNELLCNQAIVKQIDENIETVANIRRDKWVHETELRKWKSVKLKREKKNEANEENKKNETEGGDEDSGESDNEEQNCSAAQSNDSEDEPGLTNEEIDKKIDKLTKQFNTMSNKLNKAINTYRVSSLGQDRYRRRYWVLPKAGGVFVEAIESTEAEELSYNVWTEEDEEAAVKTSSKEMDEVQEKDEQHDEDEDDDKSNNKLDESLNSTGTESTETTEEQTINDETKKAGIKCESDAIESNGEDKSDDIKEEMNDRDMNENNEKLRSKDEMKTESGSITKNEIKVKSKASKAVEESNPSEVQSSLQSDQWMPPFFASMLGSLMLNNGAANGSGNGLSNSQMPLSFPFGLDLMNSTNSHSKDNQSKIWFSVLPRMPCDDSVSDSEMSQKSDDMSITKVNKEPNKANDVSLEAQQHKLLQQSPLSSLMNGLPSNLFMQAFLYPHILSSLFNQHSLGGGPCPPDTSPFSFGSSSSSKDHKPVVSHNPESGNNEPQELPKQINSALANDILNDTELEICPSLQKRITQQREQQFECPQKIPNEYQFGWWRITDSSQLRLLLEVLSDKGVRERLLQKHLSKHLNYASLSCKSSIAELDITDMDRQIAETCAFGAPTQGICPHDICSESNYCKEVALRFDIAVLEQIEGLEEKIATSSMQIRNWKPLPRISCNDSMVFKPAADFVIKDKYLQEMIDTIDKPGCDDSSENIESQERLDESESDMNPVILGRERLLALEAVIERRYLKPPLGFKSNTILISTNSSEVGQCDDFNENAADENATSGLLRWREAVREAQSSAQIALCLHFLESCIAWDKSIMRASCQFCGSGENEAQLLLCDGCDKGYHTYCFKPKMETIPDGDWFCFECQNKNTIDKVCVVCGKKGKLLNCDSCAKVFHPNCLDPPVTKPLKGKWICYMCGRKPKKPNPQKSKKCPNTSSDDKLLDTSNNCSLPTNNSLTNSATKESSKRLSNGTNKAEKESKKEKKSKQIDKVDKSDKSCELKNCKTILEAMEGHENCWPFLLPVNTKQFPTYKKIIKKPMDTTTIRTKLDASSYKNKEEFALDVRLIFDNCLTFNEDESPVGQAGHQLRSFFEAKWKELFGS